MSGGGRRGDGERGGEGGRIERKYIKKGESRLAGGKQRVRRGSKGGI